VWRVVNDVDWTRTGIFGCLWLWNRNNFSREWGRRSFLEYGEIGGEKRPSEFFESTFDNARFFVSFLANEYDLEGDSIINSYLDAVKDEAVAEQIDQVQLDYYATPTSSTLFPPVYPPQQAKTPAFPPSAKKPALTPGGSARTAAYLPSAAAYAGYMQPQILTLDQEDPGV